MGSPVLESVNWPCAAAWTDGAPAMLALPEGEFAVSYSTNHLSFPTLVQDTDLYFPRFLRCRFAPQRATAQ